MAMVFPGSVLKRHDFHYSFIIWEDEIYEVILEMFRGNLVRRRKLIWLLIEKEFRISVSKFICFLNS
jgi:hypothetical protein